MSKLLKETRSRVRSDTLKVFKALEAVEKVAHGYEDEADECMQYIKDHYYEDESSEGKSWHYNKAAQLQQQADDIRNAIKKALA